MAARGYNCVLTLGSSILAIAQDLEPALSAEKQDITARQNLGYKASQPGHRELTMSPKMLWVPTAAAYLAIQNAFENQTTLAFLALDENGVGWQGVCNVYELRRGENLGEACTATCTLTSTGRFFPYSGSTTPAN